MLKKTIVYTDYNGLERSETFRFNLTKAELTEMELSTEGGYAEMAQRIADAKDGPALYALFTDLIKKSYGEVTADGRRFMKKDAQGNPLWPNFFETEAYSQLFMELVTDANKAAEFFIGVIPSDLAGQVKAQLPAAN